MAQVLLTVEQETFAFVPVVTKQNPTAYTEFSFEINPTRTPNSFSSAQYGAAYDDPQVFIRSSVIGSGGLFVRGTSPAGRFDLGRQLSVQNQFTESPTNLLGQVVEASILVAAPRPPTFEAPPPPGPTGPTGPVGPASNFYWGN